MRENPEKSREEEVFCRRTWAGKELLWWRHRQMQTLDTEKTEDLSLQGAAGVSLPTPTSLVNHTRGIHNTHTSLWDGWNYSGRKSGTRQKDKRQPAQIAGRMNSADAGERFLALRAVEFAKGLLSREVVMDELIRAPAPLCSAVTKGA